MNVEPRGLLKRCLRILRAGVFPPLVTLVASAAGVTVALSPTAATLRPGASTTLTATVTGAANSAVTWTVDGIPNGNATVGTLAVQPSSPVVRQTYHTALSKVQSGVSVVAGDLVCVGWIVSNSPDTTTCSDSSGNTYTEVGGTGTSGYAFSLTAGATLYQFYTIATVTNPSLTVTISSPEPNADVIFVTVVQGMSPIQATVLDAYVNRVDSAVTTSHTTGAVTTTSANDFLFSLWGNDEWNGTLTEGASGFTIGAQEDAEGTGAVCYNVAGAAGSYCETMTSSTGMMQLSVLAAFKAAGGSTVTYTAPAMGGNHTIVATSAADSTRTASATMTVPSGVAVTVSPTSATISPGASTPLTATVTGTANNTVTWTVDGTANGNATVGTLLALPSTPVVRQTYHTALSKVQSGVSAVAGDLVCVGWIVSNSPDTTTCSDSSGNTYTEVGGTGSSGYAFSLTAGATLYQFYTIATATNPSLTVTISSPEPNADVIFVTVVQGMSSIQATVLDAYANRVDSAVGTSHTTGAVTTTSANDFLFCLWGNDEWNGTLAEASSGFTIGAQEGTEGADAVCYNIVGVAGSYSETINSSTAMMQLSVLAAFKAAGGNTVTYTAPAGGGSHTIMARSVADSSQSACSVVTAAAVAVHYPPVLGAAVHPVLQVGVAGSFTLPAATDPNGSPLSYQVSGLPAGLSFDPTSRVVSGSMANPGNVTFTYIATDALGLASTGSLTVVAAYAPVLGAASNPVFQLGIPGSCMLPAATDPNGSPLSYQLSGLPIFLTFDTTNRVLSGTITTALSFGFTYTATNGFGLASTVTLTLTTVTPSSPVLGVAVHPVFQVGVSGSFTLPAATDPYGSALSYQVLGLPAGLTFDPSSRLIQGVLGNPGSYSFIYTATDGFGLASTGSLTVVAAASPVLAAAVTPLFRVGIYATFTLPAASDPAGSSLSYQVSGLPVGLSFNPASRVISGTLATPGTYPFTYTVTDGLGLASTGFLTLVVKSMAPSLLSFPAATNYAYDEQGRLKTITYPDSSQVTYGYDNLNRINLVTRNGQSIVREIDYDEWSNLRQIVYLSGAVDQWTHDPTGTRLKDWTIGTVGALPQVRTYGYDSVGRLNQAEEWSSLQCDVNNRLAAATGFGLTGTFILDAFGNNISNVSTGTVPNALNNYTFNPEVKSHIPGVAANGAIPDVNWTDANGSDYGEINQLATGISTYQDD